MLGLPDGMLGTAWPSMRATFHAPVADLGLVLLATTVGAVAVSAVVGAVIRRIGISAVLAVAGGSAALGAVGFVGAPGLWLVLAASVLIGVAAGMIDSGLNTAIGLAGRNRLLNFLHAAYGAGTTIGPLLVTAFLLVGSWRLAYVAMSALDLAVALLWLVDRRGRSAGGRVGSAPGEPRGGDAHPSDDWPRRRTTTAVVAGMSTFFVYTGLEVAAGQWEASFCRGHLGLSATAAGLSTFGYWAALMTARTLIAVVPGPARPLAVVRWGSLLALAAAAVIWWQPDVGITLAAFLVLGAALAGIFPAMVALTPARLGSRRAQHVIGWQGGASAAGGSGLSAVIGLLIAAGGLSVLGPSLTALGGLLIAGDLFLGRVAPAQP